MLGRLKLGRTTAALAVTISTAVTLAGLPRVAATNAKPETVPAPAGKKNASCASCGAAAQGSPLDGLSTLGRRSQATPLLPVQRSMTEGARINMVGTANGEVAFAVNDLELGGVMPILFQRVYASDRAEDTGLGAGWSFAFDDHITIEGDDAVLTTGSGGNMAFQSDGMGGRFVLKVAEPGLHQAFDLTDGDTITERAAGMTRIYTKLAGVYRLSRVEDANGNAVAISFDGRGHVARIAAAGGAALTLKWSAGHDARLLSVSDNAGRRAGFEQDGRRLRSVADAAGSRWSYDYDAAGRLTRALDPAGRVLLRARYDTRGRAAEAGDAAGSYLFEYGAGAGGVSPRTVVTDPVGAQVVFSHTARGAVAWADDAEGNLFAAEYDAAARPARVSNPYGAETALAYDAEGRLLRQSSSDGAEKAYEYDAAGRVSSITEGGVRTVYTHDARGAVSEARVAGSTRGYSAAHNARGQLTSLKLAGRLSVSYEYDGAGNETAAVYSGAGRFESEYDAAGHRVALRLPSGLTYSYEYDARGRLTRRRGGAGRSLSVERDAAGAVSAVSGGGRWVRAERDAAGRVVALANSEGQTRRFKYDARGSLTEYVDARGARRSFEYDARGRVRGMTGADGVSLRFAYDRAGRLASVKRAGRTEAAAARFIPAAYDPPSPTAPLAQGDYGCMFGGGSDGWFEGDNWGESYGMECWNPFGDFGGFGLDGGDGWLDGPNPESCWRCQTRHKRICHDEWSAKYTRALGTDLTLTVGCALITAGTLALACAAAAGINSYSQVLAANDEYEVCILKIEDTCLRACMA